MKLYVIEADHGKCKIGVSDNPMSRLKQLESAGGFVAKNFFYVEVESQDAESMLLKLFEKDRQITSFGSKSEWVNTDYREILLKILLHNRRCVVSLEDGDYTAEIRQNLREDENNLFNLGAKRTSVSVDVKVWQQLPDVLLLVLDWVKRFSPISYTVGSDQELCMRRADISSYQKLVEQILLATEELMEEIRCLEKDRNSEHSCETATPKTKETDMTYLLNDVKDNCYETQLLKGLISHVEENNFMEILALSAVSTLRDEGIIANPTYRMREYLTNWIILTNRLKEGLESKLLKCPL